MNINNLKPLANSKKQISNNPTTESLNIGDKVRHERFGSGTVIALEGNIPDHKAIIKFEHAGEKKLLLRFAKLEVLN